MLPFLHLSTPFPCLPSESQETCTTKCQFLYLLPPRTLSQSKCIFSTNNQILGSVVFSDTRKGPSLWFLLLKNKNLQRKGSHLYPQCNSSPTVLAHVVLWKEQTMLTLQFLPSSLAPRSPATIKPSYALLCLLLSYFPSINFSLGFVLFIYMFIYF